MRTSGWRVEVLGRIAEILQEVDLAERDTCPARQVRDAMDDAAGIVSRSTTTQRRLRRWWSGADVQGAWLAIHRGAALMPLVVSNKRLGTQYIHARKRALQWTVREPYQIAVTDQELVKRVNSGKATGRDRELLRAILQETYALSDDTHQAVRSWRNRILVTTLVTLAALTILLAVVALFPTMLPMCPELAPASKTVCPSGWRVPSGGDAAKVAVVGILAGGFLAAVFALRSTEPSSSAYRITPALSCLRLSLAGLTAVLGVLIVQSGTVPGITVLTSTSQIALYAVAFGFSQEAVTKLLEGRAKAVQQAVTPTG
ncbi:hypothetical protein GCM10027053_00390 [Intrasporangium mesophilum]